MGNEHSKSSNSGGGNGRSSTSNNNSNNKNNNSNGTNNSGSHGLVAEGNGNAPPTASAPLPVRRSQPQSTGGSASLRIGSSNSPNQRGMLGSGPRQQTSQPQYLDPESMIYTHPDTEAGQGEFHYDTSHAFVANTADPFVVGTPQTPLASSSARLQMPTTPLQAPKYNLQTHASLGDVTISSPVLRSYRARGVSLSSPVGRGLSQGTSTTELSLERSINLPANNGDFPIVNDPSLHSRFLEISGAPLGMENFGNTCYLNSVVQLLYHCAPIRLRLLELQEVYASKKGGIGFEDNTILYHLCDLFTTMHKMNNPSLQKKHNNNSSSVSFFGTGITESSSSGNYSSSGKKQKISPKNFLKCVQEKNAEFNNTMQQDAHEFTLFVLNDIIETEQKIITDTKNRELLSDVANYRKKKSSMAFWKSSSSSGGNNTSSSSKSSHRKGKSSHSTNNNSIVGGGSTPLMSPLQAIIQGSYASVTACLECHHITTRDEVFLDLSVGTNQGSSLTHCLEHLGDPEYFYGDNRLLRCDGCTMEKFRAAKTIHVERLPQYALLVHLKRFQYDPARGNFTKRSDHVALPIEMDVVEYEPIEDEDIDDPEMKEKAKWNKEHQVPNESFIEASGAIKRKLHGFAKHKARFELSGFVAHLGEGPNSGHYFTFVRYGPQLWRKIDDENVTDLTEREVQQQFGVPIQLPGLVTSTAYILLYERVA